MDATIRNQHDTLPTDRRTLVLCSMASIILCGTAPAIAQLPSGYEAVLISSNQDYDNQPRINECGEVTYAKRTAPAVRGGGSQIFYYDNGTTSRVSFGGVDNSFSDINNDGQIVWTQVAANGSFDAVLYDDGVLTVLGPGDDARINSLGHVVWEIGNGLGCSGSDIMFFDGDVVLRITDDSLSNVGATLNDLDQIVWGQRNLCANPADGEIVMWDNGEITQLTVSQFQPQQPEINNLGEVAWAFRFDCNPACQEGIEIWQDGTTTLLTDWGINPEINNWGEIYFLRWHDEDSAWQAWWYDGIETLYQMSFGTEWNTNGDINDYGEVVWQYRNFPLSDIKYMRRIRTGEFDFDGAVDAGDHATFIDCMTGAGAFDGLCHCRFGDIQHDRDVDLADWAVLQNNFTASGPGGGGGG